MAGKRPSDGDGMSPLARVLTALQQDGTSFREMERIAWDKKKVRYSSSSFEQVAKDQRAGRLDPPALEAIAAVTGLHIRQVADLDDQRWGIQRSYVAHESSADIDLADVPTDRLLEEIARRAGGGSRGR